MKEEKSTKIIFSQKLCGYLLSRGFVLLGVKPNLKHERRNVFLFSDSDELRNAIFDYEKLNK